LIKAGKALFGTKKQRRFPIAPGAHVICANRRITASRPLYGIPEFTLNQAYGVWCYIAVSIADNREKNASLFIEDAGLWNRNDDEKELAAYLDGHRKSVAESIVACGNNQNVIYERTYVGYAYTMLEPGEIGTALAVSPYIVLAKNAVPKNGFSDLQHKTLSQWERMMDL
jgi:histidine decarboxylase